LHGPGAIVNYVETFLLTSLRGLRLVYFKSLVAALLLA